MIVGLVVLFCIPAFVWMNVHPATHNWVQDYRVNLKGIASPGHLSDPGPTDKEVNQITSLQTIVSIFRNDPAFYNPVVWAVSLLFLGAWIYPVLRLPSSKQKDLLCIAAIATFSLLPVYHRMYDSVLLPTIFPGLAFLIYKAPRWGAVGGGLSLWFTFMLSKYNDKLLSAHGAQAHRLMSRLVGDHLSTVLIDRPEPIATLALALFFLVVLYARPRGLALENGTLEPSYAAR